MKKLSLRRRELNLTDSKKIIILKYVFCLMCWYNTLKISFYEKTGKLKAANEIKQKQNVIVVILQSLMR